jgi:DNA-binding NarL/FixJ family response regulator
MPKLRILIVDDHEVVRKGVRSLVESRAEWQVSGEAETAAEGIRKSKQLKPDIVVLDLGLPDLNGLETIAKLRSVHPKGQILILTMQDSGEAATKALAAGASSYVLKADAASDLVAGLKAIAQHRRFLSPRVSELIAGTLANRSERPGIEVLTARQRETLKLLAEGQNSKEIAATLGISSKTADAHRAQIMQKLAFRSLSDLIFFAVREGIVKL